MNTETEHLLPLTTAQRGLWFGHKIGGAQTTMNIAEFVEIEGPLYLDDFRRALYQVASEAQTVRVGVIERDGRPWQFIRDSYHGDFPYLDLRDVTDPRAHAEAWMLAELSRPVDLANDPLWVSALFHIDEGRYYWYQRAHHVIYDGYSGGLIARRVAELYTAYVNQQEPGPCAFGQLAALVDAEAAYRVSDRHRRDRDYWMAQLANVPDPVSLARGRHQASAGGLRRSVGHLPAATVERLRELGKRYEASLPQVLIALVAAYYHRVTGTDDLVLGMPVSGRMGDVLRTTPGMVANAVTIRLAFSPELTAGQLFNHVARTVRQSLRHQQYRYEDVRRDFGLHGIGRNIAWLGVNIEPFDYSLDFAGGTATIHNVSNGSAEDLTVFVYDRGNGADLRFDFDANPALYSMEELDEHRRRLVQLIDAVLDDPTLPLAQIDLLGAQERQRLLIDWNATGAALDPRPVTAWVAQWAERSPEAIAIRHLDRRVTYRQLHERSHAQARRLIDDGIRPGDIVAVALPRDEGLLVMLLAIMRSGATYLMLDPDAPKERLNDMLDDARPLALATTPALAGRFVHGGILLVYPNDEPIADQAPVDRCQADHTAYVLYTSGSTGRPKGVQVTHANLSSFLQAMIHELAPTRDDRFLALTAITFDIAGLEFYLPWIAGAEVVLADTPTVRQPAAVARLIDEAGITVVQATPSLWRILLAHTALRLDNVHALVGGEALPGELAERLLAKAGRVTQLYGPTETTIWSTVARVDASDLSPPPIGRPIRNTRVYVLDRQRQPVVTGGIGELYIAGAGVARGYLRRMQLTAGHFMSDPFTDDGGTMYRTGDLVRWRNDGQLEYVGRVDHQVKIHGHRIEPGEIEHRLLEQRGVLAAAVVAHRTDTDSPLLVAYVVPGANHAFDEERLRAGLAQQLPDYMIPPHIIAIDSLPLTSSGKLDRAALPSPQRVQHAVYQAPRNGIEQKLAALWCDTLRLERVGIHDNFFALGGDSLTAAEMVARFPSHMGVELPFASLFEASTIAGLADHLQRAQGKHSDPLAPLLRLRAGGDTRPLFCIHPVVGLSWGYSGLLRHLDSHQPVYGLQSLALRADHAHESLEAMAADYITQIRHIQPEGPYRLLGWSLGGLIGHAMASLLEEQGQDVEFLAMLDAYPFIVDAPPKDEATEIRAVLHFLGMHELAGDDAPTTMDALFDVLCNAYDVFGLPLVQELSQREPAFVPRVATLTRHHLALAQRYVPRPVDTDVIFFHATRKSTTGTSTVLHYRPEAWRPWINGALVVHDLDCQHQDMLDAAPAAQIARLLRQRLGDTRLAPVLQAVVA